MVNQTLLGHKTEVTDGRRIWYIAELCGFIMEIDLCTNTLKSIWSIPDFSDTCAYRLLFYFEDKLYIFPYTQRIIYVYDLKTSKYKAIKIENSLELMGCVKREQYIYVFGSKCTFIKYNVDDDSITYKDISLNKSGIKEIPSFWFWTDCFIEKNCIYAPISNSNLIIKIDSKDNVSDLYLGNLPQKWLLQKIKLCNDKFYATYCIGKINEVKTYIAEFDSNGMLISKRYVENNLPYRTYPYVYAELVNGKWLKLPYGRNQILLEDVESDTTICEIENGMNYLSDIMPGLFWCGVWIDEYTLCSVNQAMGSIIWIDTNEFTVECKDIKFDKISENQIKERFENAIKTNSSLYEMNEYIDLKQYIKFICCD